MSRKTLFCIAAIAALSLVLASPVGAAGPVSLSPGSMPDVLKEVWGWVTGLWSGSDAGICIDPDGKPTRCAAVVESDLGCDIDPNGKPIRCATAAESAESDHGCGIDPNGKPISCVTAAESDHGGCIDPDGKPTRCAQ